MKLLALLSLVPFLAWAVPTAPTNTPYSQAVTVIGGTNIQPTSAETIIRSWIGTPVLPADISVSSLTFTNVGSTVWTRPGYTRWDDDAKAVLIDTESTGSSITLGEEINVRVRNTSGVNILDGQLVRLTTGAGPFVNVSLADNSTMANAQVFGMATTDIDHNGFGRVTTFGTVNGLNTLGCSEGALLYLGKNGAYTNGMPAYPDYEVVIGVCEYTHGTEGKVFIRISRNGFARTGDLAAEVAARISADSNAFPRAGGALNTDAGIIVTNAPSNFRNVASLGGLGLTLGSTRLSPAAYLGSMELFYNALNIVDGNNNGFNMGGSATTYLSDSGNAVFLMHNPTPLDGVYEEGTLTSQERVNSILTGYLPLSGGTLTGNVALTAGTLSGIYHLQMQQVTDVEGFRSFINNPDDFGQLDICGGTSPWTESSGHIRLYGVSTDQTGLRGSVEMASAGAGGELLFGGNAGPYLTRKSDGHWEFQPTSSSFMNAQYFDVGQSFYGGPRQILPMFIMQNGANYTNASYAVQFQALNVTDGLGVSLTNKVDATNGDSWYEGIATITTPGLVKTNHTGPVSISGILTASGLRTSYTTGARNEVVVTPTNNADLLRIELEPGANSDGLFIGRPGAVVPPGANGSYMAYIKAPASGTYNHALGLEAGKSDGEILHLYNKDQKHVARYNTANTEELEVRWSRPDGQDQLYWAGGADPYLTVGTGGLARAGSARVTVDGTVTATAFSGSGASLTGVTKPADILGQGETNLGTGLALTIGSQTASYYAAPTGTWSLAVSAGALRYPRDLMVVSTNASTLPAYIQDLRTGSAGATNFYYLRPTGTSTNWHLIGGAL